MENFGAELKRAREAQGIVLRDMATRTKISVGTLEALEKSEFRRIPGGLFGRSFVRTYALEVGLDADAIVERFAEELTEAERADAERRRARQPAISLDDKQFLERQRRAFLMLRIGIVAALLVVVLLVSLLLRGWWFGRAPVATAPLSNDAVPAPGVQQPLPLPPPEPVPVADASAQGAGPEAASQSGLVLDLEFTADSVTTIGVDGKSQPQKLFRTGEKVRFEATSEILIDAANAGAARLTINGRQAKALGAAGSHVRTRITKDNLTQFF